MAQRGSQQYSQPKAIVVDLDGTLLKTDKSISDRTRAALKSVKDLGFSLIIATARPLRSVQILPIDISNLYVICYNGAEVYKDGRLLYGQYVEAVDAKTIIDWLSNHYPGINLSIEMNNQLFTNFDITQTTDWITPYERVDFCTFSYRPVAKILADLSDVSDEDVDAIEAMLPPSCGICVTDRGQKLGQIAHADISKSNALRKLADILGLSLDDIMAFGDDFNDLDMIQDCGIGVAMGNSPQKVKEAADIITESNDDDGVAIELEKLTRNT